MKRLLLLSVSAGAGHQRAAAALAAWGEGRAEIQHWDVLDFVSATFRKVYADAYIRLVNNHPEWWRLVYNASGGVGANSPGQRLRRVVERGNTRSLVRAIEEFRPDRIICTHFLPAEIMSHEIARGRSRVPVYVQVTDFDLHPMWVTPGMAGYFAANDEVAARLTEGGPIVAAARVTGIPVMPDFDPARGPSREAALRELAPAATGSVVPPGALSSTVPAGVPRSIMPPGAPHSIVPPGALSSTVPPGAPRSIVPPGAPPSIMPSGASPSIVPAGAPSSIVLLMGGGSGVGGLAAQAEALLRVEQAPVVVALAGRSVEALSQLQALAPRFGGRLMPMGFTDRVASLMRGADLVVTKPGGLSTSECLALGLPMILTSPIPGQEERNADYLLEAGAALKAIDILALRLRAAALLGDPARLARMAAAARAIGRPYAARDVLDQVLA